MCLGPGPEARVWVSATRTDIFFLENGLRLPYFLGGVSPRGSRTGLVGGGFLKKELGHQSV